MIPLPPLELRRLVGPVQDSSYSNPSGERLYRLIPEALYSSVFDFGCGCGRIARQLMQQQVLPQRYLGIDINHAMVEWCQRNLTPIAHDFRFAHHDVHSVTYASGNSKNRTLALPAESDSFTLAVAHSVFTHLLQEQAEFYLRELHRILKPNAMLRSTWFFFYRQDVPVLSPEQQTLFVNENDPSQAVYYDYNFWLSLITRIGFRVDAVIPPETKGFQWDTYLTKVPVAEQFPWMHQL